MRLSKGSQGARKERGPRRTDEEHRGSSIGGEEKTQLGPQSMRKSKGSNWILNPLRKSKGSQPCMQRKKKEGLRGTDKGISSREGQEEIQIYPARVGRMEASTKVTALRRRYAL